MTGYGFFRMLRFVVVGGIFLAVINLVFVGVAVLGISEEIYARVHYGADWQAQFEKGHGPLDKFHRTVGAMSFGAVSVPLLTFWLYKSVRKDSHRTSGRKKQPERRMGNTERVMRARSKALLWNYLGLLGIVIGMLLVIFRWHIFADHANESILGIFIFGAGYCSIIGGCWWWLQAKHWSEALVVIGLWPLPIMFVPYVRIIFVHLLLTASPVLLLMLMLLTPAVLVVVIATLPDKSGVNRKQRRPMNWKDIGDKREP